MGKRIISLFIDDSSLRLMVTDGKKIREWADLVLEPGLVKSNVIINETEVAEKIRQLLRTLKVKATKVVVGVTGLHCLSRPLTFPQLPKEMLGEAVMREAKRVLPVAPEQLYISWQMIPAPQGKTQVFLVAVPRKTTDALLKTLHQVGLKPYSMDIKPLLLARVVKETTAIVVDVQKTEFDIVVMADGVPQPIRSVAFANEALSTEEKLAVIKNELSRTVTFYNSNNPEKPLAPNVPIFASGEIADKTELCQALSEALGHPVMSLSSPLESAGGFTPNLYMTNIGLVLQALSPGRGIGPSVVNLNILPVSYQPKQISLFNIFAYTGTTVAAGLVVLMIMLTQNVWADVASVRAQLNTTNELLKQKSAQRQQLATNVTALKTKITQIETSLVDPKGAFDTLEKQSSKISQDLNVTINELPSPVVLTSIGHASDTLTISGRAPTQGEVLSYLGELSSSGSVSEIIMASLKRIEGTGVDFTLLGNLKNPGKIVSSAEVMLRSMSENTTLNSVTYSGEILTLQGKATRDDEILATLRNLDGSGRFTEVNIANIVKDVSGLIDFSLTLKVKRVS